METGNRSQETGYFAIAYLLPALPASVIIIFLRAPPPRRSALCASVVSLKLSIPLATGIQEAGDSSGIIRVRNRNICAKLSTFDC